MQIKYSKWWKLRNGRFYNFCYFIVFIFIDCEKGIFNQLFDDKSIGFDKDKGKFIFGNI